MNINQCRHDSAPVTWICFVLFCLSCVAVKNIDGYNLRPKCGDAAIPSNLENGRFRIVGGNESIPGSWPWMVSLLFKPWYDTHRCGGTLINANYILTAAHCFNGSSLMFDYSNASLYTAVLGNHDTRNTSGPMTQMIAVENVTIHPEFGLGGNDYNNDIAIVKLKSPVTFTDYVSPICVSWKKPIPRQSCVIAGWGFTLGTSRDGVLNEATVPVIGGQTCRKYYGDKLEPKLMTCAGFNNGGVDTCHYDSGGPLMCKHPRTGSKWVLQGITSWGDGCALPRRPGVYTTVSRYVPWILAELCQPRKITRNKSLVSVCRSIK
ncbi:plasma kallikrein-like [Tubulanus polymorphus]|uniref:plasma kallikrein-like n=1 Tax=Tubulanus polymorphus TaxID=672921 RepID=UPI003DA35A1F